VSSGADVKRLGPSGDSPASDLAAFERATGGCDLLAGAWRQEDSWGRTQHRKAIEDKVPR